MWFKAKGQVTCKLDHVRSTVVEFGSSENIFQFHPNFTSRHMPLTKNLQIQEWIPVFIIDIFDYIYLNFRLL